MIVALAQTKGPRFSTPAYITLAAKKKRKVDDEDPKICSGVKVWWVSLLR